jgi:Ca2+-binding EF-hand superfamily protein
MCSLDLINVVLFFSFFLSFTDMKQAFDLFDKNNDGKISSDELGRVLRTLGHNYSNEEVQGS